MSKRESGKKSGMHVDGRRHVRGKRGENRNAGVQVQLQLALDC